jgi:hypothetical protein
MKGPRLIMLAALALWISSFKSLDSEKEEIIKRYFSGWEKKDWDAVASHLADGFTFTSPAPDDHISTLEFKEKCWPQSLHIKKFDFIRIIERGDEAFAIIHVITNEGKVIRNTEFFTFSKGKIKSIEVFFGGTGRGFPTNQK